ARGRVAVALRLDGPGSSPEVGAPYRPVPRTTTSDARTRLSTGTVMADGVGGAVRAATSAGERMRVAAPQLISEDKMTAPRPTARALFLRISPTPRDARRG